MRGFQLHPCPRSYSGPRATMAGSFDRVKYPILKQHLASQHGVWLMILGARMGRVLREGSGAPRPRLGDLRRVNDALSKHVIVVISRVPRVSPVACGTGMRRTGTPTSVIFSSTTHSLHKPHTMRSSCTLPVQCPDCIAHVETPLFSTFPTPRKRHRCARLCATATPRVPAVDVSGLLSLRAALSTSTRPIIASSQPAIPSPPSRRFLHTELPRQDPLETSSIILI